MALKFGAFAFGLGFQHFDPIAASPLLLLERTVTLCEPPSTCGLFPESDAARAFRAGKQFRRAIDAAATV